jgi:hypothetical protein
VAHIWVSSAAGEWEPVALAADACALTEHGPSFSRLDQPLETADDSSPVVLRRVPSIADDAWALLAIPGAPIMVNGFPIPHGIVVLNDRDEIRLSTPVDPCEEPARPIYFSTERLAAVAPYPADGRRASCPRCKQSLTAGAPAVCCPRCGLFHHATDALPCWTYGEHCAACPHPTALDAGFRWTPEDL